MIIKSKAVLGAISAAVMALGAAQAQAATYSFSQDFSTIYGLVSVTGQFDGTDTNLDGLISFAQGEVPLASVFLNLSGGAGALSFAGPQINVIRLDWAGDSPLTSTSLSGFALEATPVGAGMYWLAGHAEGLPDLPFETNTGALYLFNTTNLGSTPVVGVDPAFASAPAQVAVPEPQTYLMMLAGVAGLAAFARRKSA